MPEFYSTRQIAEMLSISPKQVAKQAQLGRIPHVRNGRCIRVPRQAWEYFMAAQTEAAMAALKKEENNAA